MANNYLAKLDQEYEKGITRGVEIGLQIECDMMICALHDPEYMCGDPFGEKRIRRVMEGSSYYLKLFQPAFHATDETDYYQQKLDDKIADALNGHLDANFDERHPWFRKYDYRKGKFKK